TDGFSRSPRSNVPPDMLRWMQDQHLKQILGAIRGSEDHDASGFTIGTLKLGPGTGEDKGRQAAEIEPLHISEEILWHLKGTKAEEVLQAVVDAVSDYLQRDRETWAELQRTLQDACGKLEWETTSTPEGEPRIFLALTRMLHAAFFEADFRLHPPGDDWFQWDVSREDPLFLKLRNERVAMGSAEDHAKVKLAVETFRNEGFRVHQMRFIEMSRLRQELSLMEQIKNEALAKIDESDIRRAICPVCPYPEATADVQNDDRITKEEN
ncbi:MAG: hypothetical protein O3B95_04730, partial [Chloroflexi bacterium]|nr:hypothetical protein [Chloroflexota bacterium]